IAGLAGLAGLFSTCLDLLERIDAFKEFEVESESIAAQFEADRLLFCQWAEQVGFRDGKLLDQHHPRLEDPQTAAVVGKVLSSIQKLFGGTQSTDPHLPFGLAPSLKAPIDNHKTPATSKRIRARWALKGKARCVAQTQQFSAFVQSLQSLVPLEMAADWQTLSNRARPDITDTSVQPSLLADCQRILDEVEEQIRSKHLLLIRIGDERQEFNRWLNASWTKELYEDFSQRRLNTTCDWILDRPAFQKWISPEFPKDTAKILWINGGPGYGKTIICARLIQTVREMLKAPHAYYFFSSDSPHRNDPYVVLRSWISQVVYQNQDILDMAISSFNVKDGQTASRMDVVELFQLIVKANPSLTFVVDGLDECAWGTNDENSPQALLKSIKHAVTNTLTRVLIVSRDISTIRTGVYAVGEDDTIMVEEYTITPDDVRSDVTAFSSSVVNKKLANKDEGLRDGLCRRIVERCDGMFLWVKLLEDRLRAGKTKKQLEHIVDQTPTSLEHLYDRNWDKISTAPEDDRERAFAILRWTAFAVRPLTVLELTEALLIVDDDASNDISSEDLPETIEKEYIETEILGICASLVELQHVGPERDLGAAVVQPVHFSAKQYILAHTPIPGTIIVNHKLGQSNDDRHNNILAKMCLRYLSLLNAWEPDSDGRELPHYFRDYAAGFWFQHVRQDGTNYPDALHLMQRFFSSQNRNWNHWRKWFAKHERIETLDSLQGNPLFYASLLGDTALLVYLLRQDPSAAQHQDGHGPAAIHAASFKGHVAAAKILLNNQADPAVADDVGWTPLHIAASKGHIEMVKLLLRRGATLEATDQSKKTP
ncbi:hypothetical protein GQ53DRAFT_623347, partial [Thozetella sp. PMI_491]